MQDEGLGLVRKIIEWGALPAEGKIKCPDGQVCRVIRHNDRFFWDCGRWYPSKKGKAKCTFRKGITVNTFFSGSHLSLTQVCQFVNLWVYNASLNLIGAQVPIKGQATLVDWSSFCREVCFDFVCVKKRKIGGPGKIVEIDESKFGKRKYHRGHHVEGQWVFGGIERDTGECFMIPVADRSRETLLPIIKDWILPGTTIMSDCWKSYDCLNDEGYHHLKVNHSISFVDATTGACTNSIESTWRAAKRHYESSGRRKDFYAGYLAKYIFLKSCRVKKLDPFVTFMKCAGELYNSENEVEYERIDSGEDERDSGEFSMNDFN